MVFPAQNCFMQAEIFIDFHRTLISRLSKLNEISSKKFQKKAVYRYTSNRIQQNKGPW